MRPGRRAVAPLACVVLAGVLLAGARPAAAEADAAALAGRAAELCGAGDLDGASRALEELEGTLAAGFGEQHSGTQIVRLNRAHVERARGHESEAARLEELGEARDERPLDSATQRALRKLRICATARPRELPHVAELEQEIPFEKHLEVSRQLLNQGNYRRALESAESARSMLADDADDDARMRLHETFAHVLLALGDFAGSLRAAEAADAIAIERGALELRITLARLTAQAGDLERASAALDEIAKQAQSEGQRAELAEARGEMALQLGSPRDALRYLEAALAGHRAVYGAEHPSTAAVHHLRGDAHRLAGDFPSAMAEYREALRVRTSALGPRHPETAMTQNAIGVLQADLRDWRGADAIFGSVLASLSESLGADHPKTITVRANRALAHWGRQQDAAAAREYGEVVAALAAKLGDDHPSVSAALRNQSRMELERGNTAGAAALLERALAAQRRSLGEGHPAVAATRLARGRVLAHSGKLAEASAEIDRAIEVLRKSRGPEHPVVVRARTLRARTAIAQGDRAKALSEAFEASRALAIHTRRTFGAISDRQRALLASDSQDVIDALLSVPDAPPRELFVSLLPHRDSVLRSVAASRAATRSGPGAEFLTELKALRRRYLAAIHGQGADTAGRIEALASAIDGLEALAAAAGSRMPTLDPNEVLSLACKHLPADAALVKFMAFERSRAGSIATRPAHAALLVRGGSCAVKRVDLGDSAPIEKAAEDFANAMREQRPDELDARETLSRRLLAPLGDAVAGTRRWFVIPDGSLWGIPIGALPDPQAEENYLFERVTVGYLTSTYELAESHAGGSQDPAMERSLLVGAPDFGPMEQGPVVLTKTGPCTIPPFEHLPATRGELEDISQLVHAPRTLTGAEATKTRLEQELERKPWLLHFATHAYFAGLGGCEVSGSGDSDGDLGSQPIAPNPLLLSGIVLAGANHATRVDGEGRGGILTAYEVAGLDLEGAGLVVLSACDTGTGLQLRGQEVQGLRWGFRAAGARALVTSLWRSNDVATRKMMRAFYEALISEDLARDPFRGAEALRRARLPQIADEKRLNLRRPLIWANFIFSGVL